MESFSTTVKNEILQLETKNKKCCMFSYLYGFLFCNQTEDDKYYIKTTNVENANSFLKTCDFLFRKKHLCFYKNSKISIESSLLRYFTVAEYKKNIFKCNDCAYYFLRSLFLMRGTISDPAKMYLLEITISDENKANDLLELLVELGFNFKIRLRQNKYVIYSKDSETIEDFLASVGANNATFTLMNNKIVKELRNNANRVKNCDDANIDKSLNASQKYLSAIKYLIESNNITRLPDQLRETAYLRLENKELNYAELGRKFSPVISKSGVFHRLEKIAELCEEFKKEEN